MLLLPWGVAEQALAVVDDEDPERPSAGVRREGLQEPPAEEGGRGEGADDERFQVVRDGEHGLDGGVRDRGAAGCEVDVPPECRLAEEGVEQPRDAAEDESLPGGEHGHHAQDEIARQVLQGRFASVFRYLQTRISRRQIDW